MTERQNIEIDYCPKCRGVWLDRGELDRLIEKASQGSESDRSHSHQEAPRNHYEERDTHYSREHDDDDHHHDPRHHKKKRESFLGDIFDF